MKSIALLVLLNFGMTDMAHAFSVGTQNLYHYNTRLQERINHLEREQADFGFPDIMGFQEAARWVHKKTLYDIFIKMTSYSGIYENTNELGVMNEGIALVSKLKSKNLISLALPDTERFSRQALNAGIYFDEDNNEILVINTHFSPHLKNRSRRVNQARFVLELVKKYPGHPVIIVGDLNDGYETDVLKEFRNKGFKDILDGEFATYDPDTNPLVTDRKWGPSRLDYILYQPSKLKVSKASLMLKENWVSDHYGLKADFEVR